jgi:MFS family permease
MRRPPTPQAGSRRQNARHYTFWACFGGYALNAMDVQIFNPAMRELHPEIGVFDADIMLIGTATLLNSAFGGWLAGVLSDRFGRVRILRYMIAWFAVFTGLCGLAQDYAQLFASRVFMGIGFGGIWTAAAVMVGEEFPAHRGWWVGAMQSGWAVGWAIAVGLPPLLHVILQKDDVVWLWRALFLIGALPVLLIPFVRRFVDESQAFVDSRKGKTADFLEIFSSAQVWTTFRTCMLSIGAHGGYYVIMAWLPTLLLVERNLTATGTWLYLVLLIFGSFAGYLISAWFSDLDLFKRRGNFMLFAAGAIASTLACLSFKNETVILALAFPLGFFASGTFSGMGAFFTELFPTRMRGSGAGFAYNFGRGVTALILLLLGAVSMPSGGPRQTGLGLSIGVFVLMTYGLVIIAAWLLPETKDKPLDADAEDAAD